MHNLGSFFWWLIVSLTVWLNVFQFWPLLDWISLHFQPKWLCCPLTIPIPLSCPGIPKCIPTILFYPICLITLPEDASPWMNRGFLILLIKHAFPHGKKKTVLWKTKKWEHQWSCKILCWKQGTVLHKYAPLLLLNFYLTYGRILIHSTLYLGPFVIVFVFYQEYRGRRTRILYYLDTNYYSLASLREAHEVLYNWILTFCSIQTEGPEGMFSIYMYTNSSLKATKNTDPKKVTKYQG